MTKLIEKTNDVPNYRAALRLEYSVAYGLKKKIKHDDLRSVLASLGIWGWVLNTKERSVTYKWKTGETYTLVLDKPYTGALPKTTNPDAVSLSYVKLLTGGSDYLTLARELLSAGCAFWQYEFSTNKNSFRDLQARPIYEVPAKEVVPNKTNHLASILPVFKKAENEKWSSHKLHAQLKTMGVAAYDMCLFDLISTYLFEDGTSETFDGSKMFKAPKIATTENAIYLKAVISGKVLDNESPQNTIKALAGLGVYRFYTDMVAGKVDYLNKQHKALYSGKL